MKLNQTARKSDLVAKETEILNALREKYGITCQTYEEQRKLAKRPAQEIDVNAQDEGANAREPPITGDDLWEEGETEDEDDGATVQV
jgi:hypothetical protein